NPVSDPQAAQERAVHFRERAGYYYDNWERLYANWQQKIEHVIAEMESLTFPATLPDMVDLAGVIAGKDQTVAYEIMKHYHRLLQLGLRAWQLHFEMLNLGYAAYYTFFQFCKTAFPDITEQTIARMLTGVEVALFQPDREVKRLAHLAVALGLGHLFQKERSVDGILQPVAEHPNGWLWLEALERAKDPWFHFSTGSGLSHHDAVWIEDLSAPLGFVCDYVAKIQAGHKIDRPLAELKADGEALVAQYQALLPGDDDRQAFQQQLALARRVFPYVENHNFFIEHWHHSVFWRKMRQLGRLMQNANFIETASDIFYLRRDEIPTALFDLMSAWAIGNRGRGPGYWPAKVARRKKILAALKKWHPPRLLGRPPKTITDPFSIMLWGITTEQLQQLLTPWDEQQHTLRGFAGSPGLVEGPARVVMSASELPVIQAGEILVCPITAPSWMPVFSKIKAVVTDVGGMMSHAAIVCREYNLPAVIGTAEATWRIKTGQRIRVNGHDGTVEILE
ncbi:MAG: PEP-utilizing enzyme, partial [Anaerolineae bacterium]